jgi:hypothetical protein
MRPFPAFAAASAIVVMAAAPEPLSFTARTVGGPGSNLPGEFYPPAASVGRDQGRLYRP